MLTEQNVWLGATTAAIIILLVLIVQPPSERRASHFNDIPVYTILVYPDSQALYLGTALTSAETACVAVSSF